MNIMLSLTDSKGNIELIKKLSDELYPKDPILAAMTITQAILESRLAGKPSQLAIKYNNLFGIKGKGTAGTVALPTQEFENGKMVTVSQEFAWNVTLMDSLKQHKRLLEKDRYTKVRIAKTFEEAADEIRKAGYATDPAYTKLLISTYNKYVK